MPLCEVSTSCPVWLISPNHTEYTHTTKHVHVGENIHCMTVVITSRAIESRGQERYESHTQKQLQVAGGGRVLTQIRARVNNGKRVAFFLCVRRVFV